MSKGRITIDKFPHSTNLCKGSLKVTGINLVAEPGDVKIISRVYTVRIIE